MDKSSLIGVIVGLACMLGVGWLASHGNWLMFWSEKGVIAVFGGTISVIFIAMPMAKIKCVPGYIKRFMFQKGREPIEVVQTMSSLGEKARRDGILALEAEIEKLQETDPFLASGLRMAVDGVDPDGIEATLRMEIMAMQERHKAGKKFFDLVKLYAPGWGLVATLIGQIGMFGHLGGDIDVLGHMLAVAVVATMYGTVLANAVAGPIGDKLAIRSAEEILNREMMLQGILSIQAGDNPRVTLDRMTAFIPRNDRAKLKLAA
ncbi:MAG: MotA/TolQ/ExbB proton channel family protein [Phycisphaeraceae bacterium]|nr:MAG: MotA/TolQ/ExbB proton channel family protein [Phycisphaeraceae bacterium]